MSVRVETTYLATCDYPDCHMTYDFWELTEEDAILEVIDNGEWLCLFAGDNKPRFFCPAHLRYVQKLAECLVERILRFQQSIHANDLARLEQVLRGYEHTATTAKTAMR